MIYYTVILSLDHRIIIIIFIIDYNTIIRLFELIIKFSLMDKKLLCLPRIFDWLIIVENNRLLVKK